VFSVPSGEPALEIGFGAAFVFQKQSAFRVTVPLSNYCWFVNLRAGLAPHKSTMGYLNFPLINGCDCKVKLPSARAIVQWQQPEPQPSTDDSHGRKPRSVIDDLIGVNGDNFFRCTAFSVAYLIKKQGISKRPGRIGIISHFAVRI
jgi:hypothetical protein